MALMYTPENPEIGAPCPDFELPAVEGKNYSLSSFSESKALVIAFICNHCPYVQAIEERFLNLAHSYDAKDAQFVAICSNDAERYPDDSFEALKTNWQEKEFRFPYLHDDSQAIAKKFGAICTPDFFIYDENRKLAYRGRLDDSWKEPDKVTQEEMREAIDRIIQNQPPLEKQNPAMGCSIKWKDF